MVRAQTQRTQPAIHGQQHDNLRDHALAYADIGWPIFPLQPGNKRPACPSHNSDNCDRSDPRCAAAGGHQGWEQRATTNPDRITRAWAKKPWGIGIACGPAGLVVIDLDIPKFSGITGAESLRQLEHDHGQQLPATFTVATPSGGRHLYYRTPDGSQIRNSAGTVAPSIDIRAAGGYVVAPPTIVTAGSYDIIDVTIPKELPTWFHQLVEPPEPAAAPQKPRPLIRPGPERNRLDRYVQGAVNGELDRIRRAPGGRRNHELFVAAACLGELVAAGAIDRHEVEQILEEATMVWLGIAGNDGQPFTATEARQTIASGLRKGATKPRQLPTDPETGGSTRSTAHTSPVQIARSAGR